MLATAAALRAMGAGIERAEDGHWRVDGVGVGGLGEPEDVLDLGNSGTSARLLLGLLATHKLTAFVTGDSSLRRRPMRRVIDPLSRFGARFVAREGGRLPLAVTGAADPVPIEYRLPVPSAQVKSAVLLAGLNTPGVTTRDRERADPRPYRAHAAAFRRDASGRGRARRRPAHFGRGPAGADRGADHRAGRPVLGRLSARRGADRAGLRGQDRECRAQPVAHRAACEPRRDGGRHRVREPARGGRRAGRRSARARRDADRRSTCRPSARRR